MLVTDTRQTQALRDTVHFIHAQFIGSGKQSHGNASWERLIGLESYTVSTRSLFLLQMAGHPWAHYGRQAHVISQTSAGHSTHYDISTHSHLISNGGIWALNNIDDNSDLCFIKIQFIYYIIM